ncbi:hypothetical protein TNCT_529641, partial [Trichonephila clavata]
ITNEIMIAQELKRAKGLTSIPEEKSTEDHVIANSNGDTPAITQTIV